MTAEETDSPGEDADTTRDDRTTRGGGTTRDVETTGARDSVIRAVPDGGTEPAPEEMSLEELRREIEAIDREIVDRIARRTYIAETIAEVKAERGLPTTDESQEVAVMERAGENAEQFDLDANLVKAIFRLLIELNKVHQRSNR